MRKMLGVTIAIALITGCTLGEKQMSTNMNNVSLGMTKQEVIKAMGQPHSVNANSGVEFLIYQLCDEKTPLFADGKCMRWNNYHVKLIGGKVDSYGR